MTVIVESFKHESISILIPGLSVHHPTLLLYIFVNVVLKTSLKIIVSSISIPGCT